MDLTMPEELLALKRLVASFVEKELLTLERELEENDGLPGETWKALEQKSIELGIYTFHVPERYGGAGVGMLGQVLVFEEMGKVAIAFRHLAGGLGGPLGVIAKYGTEDQIQRYYFPLVRGEKHVAWGATEPAAGSDLNAMESAAVREGDKWVINGKKHFITLIDRADFLVTFVITDKEKRSRGGMTGFILDKGAPGFIIGRQERMMGRAGLHSYQLFFDNLVVPDSQVFGPVGEGYKVLMDNVHNWRLQMGGTCVGTAQRLLDMSVDYAKARRQFGRPIADFQAIQWMLADSEVELHATRLMTYEAAWKADNGMDVSLETAIIKTFATEMVGRVADRAMQIHGGMGYSKELPIESIYRAVRLLRIAEGSSEIQRMIIARQLYRQRGKGGR